MAARSRSVMWNDPGRVLVDLAVAVAMRGGDLRDRGAGRQGELLAGVRGDHVQHPPAGTLTITAVATWSDQSLG